MTVSKYATVVATCGSVMYFISGETFLVEETVTNYDCGTILQLCQTEDHLLVSFEDLPLVRGFRLKHPYDLLLCLNLSDLNLEIGHCLTVESPETFDVHKLKVRGRSSSSNFIHYDLKKRRSSSINSNCYEPTTFGKGPIVVDFMAVHKDVLWLARSDGLMLLIGMGSNDAVGELLAQYRIVQLTTDNAMVRSANWDKAAPSQLYCFRLNQLSVWTRMLPFY